MRKRVLGAALVATGFALHALPASADKLDDVAIEREDRPPGGPELHGHPLDDRVKADAEPRPGRLPAARQFRA